MSLAAHRRRLEKLERQIKPAMGPVVVWHEGKDEPPSEEECRRIEAQNGLIIHVQWVAPPPRDAD